MEFIQKKTVDSAIEVYLTKAASEDISLTWDRYEGQLPECGFCEAGLSCRDCLQGPCISHPFREASKEGVCGKDKDTLAAQSFLRLIIKGAMSIIGDAAELSGEVAAGAAAPVDRAQAEFIINELARLLDKGESSVVAELPAALRESWQAKSMQPEGTLKDIFKAAQKLEGGFATEEELLLRGVKASLLACMAGKLRGRLKEAVFGANIPTSVEMCLGVLEKDLANILLVGEFSPVLKGKILQAAEGKKVKVTGAGSEILLAARSIPPVTNYASQEIPLLTGAVDLVVAGDKYVNPSLAGIAKAYAVPVVYTEALGSGGDLDVLAARIVDKAEKSFDVRQGLDRVVPQDRETAVLGFSGKQVPARAVAEALRDGRIKGIAIISGCGNVKYTQDRSPVVIAEELLKRDILCLSTGEASVTLAKYGLLNPAQCDKYCGSGLKGFLASLGGNIPPVLDFGRGENGTVLDLLLALAGLDNKPLASYPLVACFPEANRSSEAVEALWYVAHGITAYFWPALPVTGSPKVMTAMNETLKSCFGAALPVLTDKKLEPLDKARMILKHLQIENASIVTKGGEVWKKS
ncbi:MAG: hypothetical protein U1C55_05775 [Smithellaceae bacterium]|nr:hypothetical protein [Smithellaceae bacterium]